MGFRTSSIDPCLFIRKDCLILLYVDVCLLFGQTEQVIQELIQQLSTKYNIGEQGSVQDFLGIHITTDVDGTIHFRQEGFITSILQDLHLDQSSHKFCWKTARI
jgi:hypothetical protein